MSKTSLALSGRKGKSKCGTNAGKFLSLQAAYRRGDLSGEDEAAYEAIVGALWSLYKQAAS